MPSQAILKDDVDAVLTLADLANALVMLATEGILEKGPTAGDAVSPD